MMQVWPRVQRRGEDSLKARQNCPEVRGYWRVSVTTPGKPIAGKDFRQLRLRGGVSGPMSATKLLETAAVTQAVVGSIPCCVVDDRDRITEVNAAFAERLNRSAPHLVGIQILELMRGVAVDEAQFHGRSLLPPARCGEGELGAARSRAGRAEPRGREAGRRLGRMAGAHIDRDIPQRARPVDERRRGRHVAL